MAWVQRANIISGILSTVLKDDKLLPEVAYYYPGTYWRDETTSNWIKNVLLYFDGIATLIPRSARDKALEADPDLVGPLLDRGILRFIEPRDIIDENATSQMAQQFMQILSSPATSNWHTIDQDTMHSLSLSRVGVYANPEAANLIISELEKRNFAAQVGEGDRSIGISYGARVAILCLWAQLLMRPGREHLGLDLIPITNDGMYARALAGLSETSTSRYFGHMLHQNLDYVSFNLSSVSLDEILSFRERHGADYRGYRRYMYRLANQVALTPDRYERHRLMEDQSQDLRDQIEQLRMQSRTAFKLKGSVPFILGVAGAATALVSGHPDLVAFTGGMLPAFADIPRNKTITGPYSYVIDVVQKFGF